MADDICGVDNFIIGGMFNSLNVNVSFKQRQRVIFDDQGGSINQSYLYWEEIQKKHF